MMKPLASHEYLHRIFRSLLQTTVFLPSSKPEVASVGALYHAGYSSFRLSRVPRPPGFDRLSGTEAHSQKRSALGCARAHSKSRDVYNT